MTTPESLAEGPHLARLAAGAAQPLTQLSAPRASAPALASAIYRGNIRHRRHLPHPHAFSYDMFMLYLDLEELDRVFDGTRWWSLEQRNLAQFRRSDYLGDPQQPLIEAVRERIFASSGQRVDGPIRMLAHLRYFGYCFNPVVFYYCYQSDGVTLDTIVAEITNTPWKERHAYVLPLARAQQHGIAHSWEFDKAFHVSPFLPMDRRYHWRFTVPDESIRVHMDVSRGEQAEFDATLVLQRQAISPGALNRCLLAYPWMTAKVALAIHWQALLIWLRHNPVYDHPTKAAKRS